LTRVHRFCIVQSKRIENFDTDVDGPRLPATAHGKPRWPGDLSAPAPGADRALHQGVDENGEEHQHAFDLRRIIIWNLSSNRRASALCWDDERGIDLETCAQAILQRWGASENTFNLKRAVEPLGDASAVRFPPTLSPLIVSQARATRLEA
jgi:hypothetical protein